MSNLFENQFNLQPSKISVRIVGIFIFWCLLPLWSPSKDYIVSLCITLITLVGTYLILKIQGQTNLEITYKSGAWSLSNRTIVYNMANILIDMGLWLVIEFKTQHHRKRIIIYQDSLSKAALSSLKRLIIVSHNKAKP